MPSTACPVSEPRTDPDAGNAVAEYIMVLGLAIVLFGMILQVGFALHVRNTMTAGVSDGARYGARADSSPAQGAARAADLITASLSSRFAGQVSGHVEQTGGAQVVTVVAPAPLPVIGPWGLGATVTVEGHAYVEGQ